MFATCTKHISLQGICRQNLGEEIMDLSRILLAVPYIKFPPIFTSSLNVIYGPPQTICVALELGHP
jgi:hypothetical protein